LLIDGGIVRIEDNEGSGTVGVALKDSFGRGFNGKEEAKLLREGADTKVTKGELESPVAALDIDLKGDKSVGISRCSRRHDCCEKV
jgi:hypothetical protein